jgi:hypothetical protein
MGKAMTKAIWKYTLERDTQSIAAPIGAKWLCAHEQGNDVCVWAEVDTAEKELILYCFEEYCTGEPFRVNGKYLGTCFFNNGSCVLHVYLK